MLLNGINYLKGVFTLIVMRMLAIKQLIFKRIFIIILINQGLYISKNMGNKVNINLDSLKDATISYGNKTYPLKKRIATYIHVMYILGHNIEHSDFRSKYLDLYGKKGKSKEPEDPTVFYRSSLKYTFKRQFPNSLKDLICYQEIKGKKTVRYEEECGKRDNWIIKFYGSGNESYIETKFSNVDIRPPKENIKATPKILSEKDFLKALEEYRNLNSYNEIYRLVYSLLNLSTNEYFKFSKQGIAFCVIYFLIALRQEAESDKEKLGSGMTLFSNRFDKYLGDNYDFRLQDIFPYVINIDNQPSQSIAENLNKFLNTKRSK